MKELLLSDFNYELPEERIAQTAAEPRDSSKLLVYRKGSISDAVFRKLPDFITNDSALFFNNAKVIPARLRLQNAKGAHIEVFLLQPHKSDYASSLNSRGKTEWQCLIGNLRKWKSEEILKIRIASSQLELKLLQEHVVEFSWQDGEVFSAILEKVGKLPLPPYIRHEADEQDMARYQTVYSKVSGSVAAPTAGLHFTPEVLADLRNAGVEINEVTLHVSAGTFLPVKTSNALEHDMHEEVFEVNRALIERLSSGKQFVCVGTTACRVMESLWLAAARLKAGQDDPFRISQFEYRERDMEMGREEVSELLGKALEDSGTDKIMGATRIMIVPGYRFRMTDALITNFHQPSSTLLMLIQAFVGDDRNKIYRHALDNDYRFLSYGDSSLLLP